MPQPEVRLVSMTEELADEVGRVTLAAYDAYGRLEGPYRRQLADPRRRAAEVTDVLVALRDEHVVGTATLVLPDDPGWEPRPVPAGDAGMRVLAVDPATEGGGVGRALVTACIEGARQRGAQRLVVTTMEWMTRAHRLYERMGFVAHPEQDVRFPSGVGHTLTLDLGAGAARFGLPGPAPDPVPWFEDVWRR